MVLFTSPRFGEHTPPPGHPESPERAAVFEAVAAEWRARGGEEGVIRPATRDELVRVHAPDYVDGLLALAGQAAMLDEDTYTSPESVEVALLAAGAAIEAARSAVSANAPALALVRPPGHHAEAARAMGFCLFNNVAVAAASLRAAGCARVAIVDIDVHHGNGTQAIFEQDPSVLYVSTHQWPYYPGTGAADERGIGAGMGTTLNLPLAAGAGDAAFVDVYRTSVVPALDAFGPDALLVSAGFDAHRLDPLGGLKVTTEGYRQVVEILDAAARRVCQRRSTWVTEGGYHLAALGECLEATLDALV